MRASPPSFSRGANRVHFHCDTHSRTSIRGAAGRRCGCCSRNAPHAEDRRASAKILAAGTTSDSNGFCEHSIRGGVVDGAVARNRAEHNGGADFFRNSGHLAVTSGPVVMGAWHVCREHHGERGTGRCFPLCSRPGDLDAHQSGYAGYWHEHPLLHWSCHPAGWTGCRASDCRCGDSLCRAAVCRWPMDCFLVALS